MSQGELIERLERAYPQGSYGAEVVAMHRTAQRLLGRRRADRLAEECFERLDEARDRSLAIAFHEALVLQDEPEVP